MSEVDQAAERFIFFDAPANDFVLEVGDQWTSDRYAMWITISTSYTVGEYFHWKDKFGLRIRRKRALGSEAGQ